MRPTRPGQAISASKSRGSRCRTASISATSRPSGPYRLHLVDIPAQRAQHRAHMRPGRLRLDPHAHSDPADELIGAKRLEGQRTTAHRRLQLIGQPRAEPHQLVVAHPLGRRHHRRPDHTLGPGPV